MVTVKILVSKLCGRHVTTLFLCVLWLASIHVVNANTPVAAQGVRVSGSQLISIRGKLVKFDKMRVKVRQGDVIFVGPPRAWIGPKRAGVEGELSMTVAEFNYWNPGIFTEASSQNPDKASRAE